MTKKKDLKKRVRARQEKTGESYTAALAQLTRRRIPEAPSATTEAQAAGLRCQAVVSKKLRTMGDLRPLFARLRELLEGLGAEACGPLLRGEPAPRRIPQMRDLVEARRFFVEVRAGKRGLSPDGRLVAFAWGDLTVVAAVSLIGRKPLLQVGLLEALFRGSDDGRRRQFTAPLGSVRPEDRARAQDSVVRRTLARGALEPSTYNNEAARLFDVLNVPFAGRL